MEGKPSAIMLGSLAGLSLVSYFVGLPRMSGLFAGLCPYWFCEMLRWNK